MRDNTISAFHRDVYQEAIVETKLWRLRTYIVNDPGGIMHVLADNADNYVKGNIELRIPGAQSDRGILAKEDWVSRRRTMSSGFDYRSILTHSSVIVDCAQALLARWSTLPEGTVIEVSQEMVQLALGIISCMLFSSDSAELAPIIERTYAHHSEKILDPFDLVPLLNRPWTIYKRYRARGMFKAFEASIDRLVAERAGKRAQPGDDFLGQLLRERDPETGRGLSPQEIRGRAITVVGAGHQSTALALTWTWYLLAQHPVHEARLHAELDQVLAGRTAALDDLPRLVYTRMVIEEALRLYPPFPIMAWREALADDEVCGAKIHKGATVTIAPWVLHRHTKLWDQPERFDPERFSPERSKGRSRYAYLPFGAGHRVCIGASFSMTQLTLILATLAQHYRLRLAPGCTVEPQGLISLRPRHGLQVKLESRRQGF